MLGPWGSTKLKVGIIVGKIPNILIKCRVQWSLEMFWNKYILRFFQLIICKDFCTSVLTVFLQWQSGVEVESLGSEARLFKLELKFFLLHELGQVT